MENQTMETTEYTFIFPSFQKGSASEINLKQDEQW